MSIVFMLSGQGSQYYQMGRDLYENDKIFQHHIQSLDKKISAQFGQSVLEEIYTPGRDFQDSLDQLVLSGLSILLVELALIRTLHDKGLVPDVLLGSSFGTLVSCIIANCLDETDAIECLIEHGKLFQRTCEEGCMVAVLGSPQLYESDFALQALSELVGINFDSSFVISMPHENFQKVEVLLNNAKVPHQKLPVGRAYHSQWIDNAKESFFNLYSKFDWKNPRLPIVCTSRSLPLIDTNIDTFWHIVRGPIHFQKTISWLEARGSHTYIDVGPSGTLATFLKYALPEKSNSRAFPILSPYKQSVRNLDHVIKTLVSPKLAEA
jgi:bacillaene synthase trans-acting acyltransferase